MLFWKSKSITTSSSPNSASKIKNTYACGQIYLICELLIPAKASAHPCLIEKLFEQCQLGTVSIPRKLVTE